MAREEGVAQTPILKIVTPTFLVDVFRAGCPLPVRTHSFAHGEAIFSPPSSAGAFGISLGTVDGQLNFAVRIEEGVYREMTGYKCPVTAGKWSFVSGRYDGSSMYMNVDGYVCQFKHFTQAPFSEKALLPEESTSGIAIGRELAAEMVTGAPEDKRIFQGEIYAVSMKSSAAFSVSDTHCLPSETASDLVQYGNLRTQGGETNFAMRLEGPKGVPGSYSDDTDGSYTFRYTPAVAGHYRMYMAHGVEVPCSATADTRASEERRRDATTARST